jgi:hypothetical protein
MLTIKNISPDVQKLLGYDFLSEQLLKEVASLENQADLLSFAKKTYSGG